jgi:DNA polymerase-3 subunit gamma/tau
MADTVLARRYRSRSFDEVVGQEPIARTLKNAIHQNKVAHAYLFVGTRGVGKTSMARIFANALNNPDNEPAVADAIFTGNDTDTIEIDAASNRSVEDARELIANAVYLPLRNRSKIYIIDEVHMLTKDAFNTLLKLMEEPPEHVKFVLATTEPHKVLPTIQSRCQRFDFRNIPTAEIANHLRAVLESEDIRATDDLLAEIARLASGSMRDALSILDRIIAASDPGAALDLPLLESVLGMPERTLIARLVDAVASGDPKHALETADELLNKGSDPEQLLGSLAQRFRDLMIAAACGPDTNLLDLTGDARAHAIQQAQQFDTPALIHLIAQCESVQRAARASANPRALFDALIARLAMSEHIADAAALLAGTPAPQPKTASAAQGKA